MIKLVIWDLDDLLHTPPIGFWSECDIVAAKVACSLGFSMGMDLALEVADQGFKKYGHPCGSFIHDHEIDHDMITHRWLKNLDFSYLEPCAGFIHEMKKSKYKYKHVILTHSPTFWGEFIINSLGYSDLFHHIVGADLYEGRKDTSKEPFHTVMALYDNKADECVMIDDQPSNLKIPKEMGIKAVLINNNEDITFKRADARFSKPIQAIEAINNYAL